MMVMVVMSDIGLWSRMVYLLDQIDGSANGTLPRVSDKFDLCVLYTRKARDCYRYRLVDGQVRVRYWDTGILQRYKKCIPALRSVFLLLYRCGPVRFDVHVWSITWCDGCDVMDVKFFFEAV